MQHLKIGELAKQCNINKETIRYYEKIGLIPEPDRTESGYRQYPVNLSIRLSFIKRMQELGFSLQEIDRLLSIADGKDADCNDVYQFTEIKLAEIAKKIEDLQRIQAMLLDLQSRCPGKGDLSNCPILESLMEDEK